LTRRSRLSSTWLPPLEGLEALVVQGGGRDYLTTAITSISMRQSGFASAATPTSVLAGGSFRGK